MGLCMIYQLYRIRGDVKMKKKHCVIRSMFLCLVLIAALSLLPGLSCTVQALDETAFITLNVNGNIIATDVWPYMKNGNIFVPVRFVSEALSAKVQWIPEEKKVVIIRKEKTIELWQGSDKLMVNGEQFTLDTAVEVLNNRTMVPVKYIAEHLDFTTEWHNPTYTLHLYREGLGVPATSIAERTYTDDDIIWLSRIVCVEARGLSVEGKVAVANVVLNRKRSPSFPNSICDVIFQVDVYQQFPPAHREGFRELVPDDQSIIAAKMALEGINNIDRCLFFNNRPFKGKDKDLYKIIEGEYFYY
jgi:N-acetylmuramoyl-L-alanine amidase